MTAPEMQIYVNRMENDLEKRFYINNNLVKVSRAELSKTAKDMGVPLKYAIGWYKNILRRELRRSGNPKKFARIKVLRTFYYEVNKCPKKGDIEKLAAKIDWPARKISAWFVTNRFNERKLLKRAYSKF